MRGSSQGGHTIKVEFLMGCSKAQRVPPAVNEHSVPIASVVPGSPGEGCLPWTASCSLELLGVRRSGCVSMDTCLNSDASLLNADRPRQGNRAVAQGEKILRQGSHFQSILSNIALRREKLWSGVVL